MSWLSGSRKTYVSSVLYNLAGDRESRQNFLKTTVIGSILSGSKESMADLLVGSYLHGSGVRFRNFIKWCESSGYNDKVGLVQSSIQTGNSLDLTVLAEEIPHDADETVVIQTSEIGGADYSYWVERYMLENHYDLIDTNYTFDIDETTNDITITFEDTTTETFSPAGYDSNGRYLYATYLLSTEETAADVVTGTVVTLGDSDSFPDITGWTENSYTDVPTTVDLVKTTVVDVTYSDSTPSTSTTTTEDSTDSYDEIHGEWEQTTYQGLTADGSGTHSLREIQYQDTTGAVTSVVTVSTVNEDIGGGVTRTTTTTVTTESLTVTRSYRIDTQDIVHETNSPVKTFIYEKDSGNATLDAMFLEQETENQFYPFIPFRINNVFVSDQADADDDDSLYDYASRAFRRATNSAYSKTESTIRDNDSLSDIDFAYAAFGVSLNVYDNASKKYVYQFFKAIFDDASIDNGDFSAYYTQYLLAKASQDAYTEWLAAQATPSDPLYGTTAPTRIPYPTMPTTSIQVRSTQGEGLAFNMKIKWASMSETTYIGVGKTDATKGDLWFETGSSVDLQLDLMGGAFTATKTVATTDLYWQDGDNTYRKLSIVDLVHENLVYNGKIVTTTAKEALADSEESSFLVPLQRDLYRSMGLIDGTQMTTACSYMIFNCYTVVKEKWYQTGAFKVILIIVVIVVSIYTGGAASGLAAGLLGGTLAAAGITGLAAAIILAVADALIAMILAVIFTKLGTALFGEKIGAVIGVIASVIAMNVGAGMAKGLSMSESFASLMKADNLMALTNAAGRGYQAYAEAAAKDYASRTQDLMESYNSTMKEISDKYLEVFGYNGGYIDPLMFTDAVTSNTVSESMGSFIQRTMMTGSDIADMSMSMVEQFSDITLSLDLPT